MQNSKDIFKMLDLVGKRLKRSTFLHLCFGITFLVSGVIVNAVQCVLFLTLFRFSKYWYRKINYYLAYTLYSQFVFLGEWWGNVTLTLYTDKDDYIKYFGTEHAYLIMNHSWDIDWFVGWFLCDRVGVLGNAKAYAKKAIKYVPVIGWSWLFGEFAFLEREFTKDKDIIGRQITELMDHPDPIWLLLFAEGTRFTKEKHEIAVKFAREKGLPELKYHLNPRTKGFLASIPSMRGKMGCILDLEVAFHVNENCEPPTIMDVMNGKRIQAHMYCRRIPFEDVPENEAEADQFLKELYYRKDKIRDNFVKHGDFFATSDIPRLETFLTKRRLSSLINFICWAALVLIPILTHFCTLLFSGEIYRFLIGITIVGFFYVLLKLIVGMSETKKSSSYGTQISSNKNS